MNKIILYTIALLLHCISAYSQQIINPKWTTPYSADKIVISQDGAKTLQMNSYIGTVMDSRTGLVISTLDFRDSMYGNGCFSQSGSKIATIHRGMGINVWDANTGELLSTIRDRNDRNITSVTFCNNEKYILAKCYDYIADVWEIETTKKILEFGKGADKVVRSQRDDPMSSEETSYGDLLVTDDYKGTVKLWNTTNGALVHTLSDVKTAAYCTFSEDGKKVALYSRDGTIIVNTENGNTISTFNGIGGEVAKFSKDGTRLFLHIYNEVFVVDVITNLVVRKFPNTNLNVHIEHFEPSKDGGKVALHYRTGEFGIWDVNSGSLLRNLYSTSEDSYLLAKFNDNDMKLIVADKEKALTTWDVSTGLVVSQSVHFGEAKKLLINKKGTHVLFLNNFSLIQLLDNSNGKLELSLKAVEESYNNCAFNTNGDKIAVSTNSVAEVRELSGNLLFRTDKFNESIISIDFYNSSDTLVVCYSKSLIRAWDVVTGKMILNQKLDVNNIRRLTVSPDNKMFAIVHSNKLGLYHTNGSEIKILDDSLNYDINSLFFSSSGKYIAVSVYGRSIVWETATGKRVMFNKGSYTSINSSEKRIAVTDQDSVTVWELSTGKQISSIKGHIASIWSAVLDNDGNRVLTCSEDNSVQLWDAGSGSNLAYLDNDFAPAYMASYANNNNTIVAANRFGTIKSYDIGNNTNMGYENYKLSKWTKCNCPYDDIVSDLASTTSEIFAVTRKGVLKSTDDGKNWFLVNVGIPDEEITTIETVQDTVYIGTAYGMFYSHDKGKSWSKSDSINSKVVAMSERNDTLYISVGYYLYVYVPHLNSMQRFNNLPIFSNFNSISKTGNTIYLATTYSSMLRSTDNGQQWQETTSDFKEVQLSEVAANGNLVFTISTKGDLYRSMDGGIRWYKLEFFKDIIAIRAYFVNNTVYITTSLGIYYSNNNGETWEKYPPPFPYEEVVSSMLIGDNNIILGTYGFGIHSSNDNGITWGKTGYSCADLHDLGIIHNRMYAYRSGDVWESIDSSGSWNRFLFYAYGTLQGDSTYLFKFSRQNDKAPFRSKDKGNTWRPVTRPENTKHLSEYLYHNGTLYLGSDKGVSVSSDKGDTWSTVAHLDTNVIHLGLSRNTVFVEYSVGAVYYTSDNGENWRSDLSLLGVSPSFFVFDSSILAGNQHGLIRTSNAGKTWVSVGFRRNPVVGLTKIDSFFVFGQDDYILITDSTGTIWHRWVKFGSEVLTIKRFGDNLFALTRDGIWKTDIGISVIPISTIQEEKQTPNIDPQLIFPNPASNTITVQTQNDTPYSYLIINQLGETVQSGKVDESTFSHQISVNTLLSGTYIFVTHTSGIITKQIFSVIK